MVPFTSLRWLQSSQHRLSRRIRWHQVLLFLLRAAILTLLVLAAARPVLLGRGSDESVQRFVIVDAGRAMQVQDRNAPPPLERARELGTRLLDRAMPGRPVSAIIAGNAPRATGPLTEVPGRYENSLNRLRADGTETPVSSALRLIPPLQRNRETPDRIQLDILTANLAAGWNQTDIADFMREIEVPVTVRIVDLSPRAPRNAWIASADIFEGRGGAPHQIRVRLNAVGDKAMTRTLRISGIRGIPDASRNITLHHGEPATEIFEVPGIANLENQVAAISLEPSDMLPDDDRYWLPLNPRGRLSILLVAPEPTRVRERSPAFHLRTALDTLSESRPGRFRLNERTPAELDRDAVLESDLVFLVDPREISDVALESLRKRVSEGSGLMIFPGPETDTEFYNRALHTPLQPSEGLASRPLGEITNPGAEGNRVRLSGLHWEHPLLSPFMDPAYGDISLAGFRAYRNLPDPETPVRDSILATFPDNTPALLETRFGAGRVLLLNSTANDSWSDFPRRKGFLPFIDGVISHLAGFLDRNALRVGEPLRIPQPAEAQPETLQFLDPGNTPLPFEALSQGGRDFIRIDAVATPGVYRLAYKTVEGAQKQVPLVVQAGRAFSSLARIDDDILRQWWEPAEVSLAPPDAEASGKEIRARSDILLAALLALALLAFLAETLLSSRLCPRIKPAIVSDSVVYRRGFFVRRESAGENPADSAGAKPS